jgi:hypothetical protein
MDILADRVERMACGKCSRILDVSGQKPFTAVDCPDCGTRQNVPALFGQFLLIEQLGGGGMGSVYRAVDQALGRFVAIKVMKQALGVDATLVDSFLREARAAAALNHPNIVQIYSCGQEKGQPYIVMELVNGGRLDLLMAGRTAVDEGRALEVGLNVAEGLKAANEMGLVHGDIKPANILFDKAGTAKVVDFGLAQFVNRQQEMGGIWGTPYYISPERARGGKADHRSDIYSLGATLYHAMAARPPFDGKTAADVVLARLKRPPPDIRDVNEAIHATTADLLLRMMAVDPAVRYPTSASLLADLREALEETRILRAPTRKMTAAKQAPRAPVTLYVGAALLFALIALAIYVFATAAGKRPARVTPPIAATQVVAAVAATGTAETAPADEDLDPRKVVFFKKEFEQQLVEAEAALATDTPLVTIEKLAAVAAGVPPNSARAMWIKLLEVPPLWLEGKKLEASIRLDDVSRAKVTAKDASHPVYMPKIAARYFLGDVPREKLASATQKWPEWYGDLLGFYDGVQSLVKGDIPAAKSSFDAYLSCGRAEPAWVYGMRPAAQKWVDQMAGIDKLKAESASRVAAGQTAELRAELEALAKSVAPQLRKSVGDELDKLKKAEQQVTTDQKVEEERAQKEKIEAERRRVDEEFEKNRPLVNRKEFGRAAQALSGLEASLETSDGKDSLKVKIETMGRMGGLKQLIVDSVERNPFRRQSGSDLGDVMEANQNGVRVLVLGKGLVQIPWEKVSPVSMGRMAHYYVAQVGNPARKADLTLSLAVYCHVNSLSEPAAKYAAEAVRLNGQLEATAKRLLPNVPLK